MLSRRNIIIGGVVLFIILVWIGFSLKKSQPVNAEPVADKMSVQEVYQQALAFKNNRQLLEAKEAYQRIISDFSDFENIEQIQKELESLNMEIIYSNAPTPRTVIHEIAGGDTLGGLAKKYNTTVHLIKINNNLKSDVIRLGQKLRIWTGAFSIFVDKSQNKLTLKDDDGIVKVYDVSTGRDNSTPVGEFKVTSKLIDPVWFKSGAVVPPESPENELGSRWMGFDIPGYGIHGTIKPETIGQQVTAGCVRMKNEEVEELYNLIPLGTTVSIVD